MEGEPSSDLTPYELRVKKNIEENRNMLKGLGLLNETTEHRKSVKIVRRPIAVSSRRSTFKTESESPSIPYIPQRRTRRSSSIIQSEASDELEEEHAFSVENEGDSHPHKKRKIVAAPVFGPIQGVSVGEWWQTRMECSAAGVHRPTVAGIHAKMGEGCYSVALSGGYEDDLDYGDFFTYTGSGGRDLKGTKANPKNLRTAPQTKDQELEGPNAALACNIENRLPVRVIRGYKLQSPFAPLEGYRYDGLYSVEKCWTATGLSGYRVCKFALMRLPDQDPPPWKTSEQFVENGSTTLTQNDGEESENVTSVAEENVLEKESELVENKNGELSDTLEPNTNNGVDESENMTSVAEENVLEKENELLENKNGELSKTLEPKQYSPHNKHINYPKSFSNNSSNIQPTKIDNKENKIEKHSQQTLKRKRSPNNINCSPDLKHRKSMCSVPVESSENTLDINCERKESDFKTSNHSNNNVDSNHGHMETINSPKEIQEVGASSECITSTKMFNRLDNDNISYVESLKNAQSKRSSGKHLKNLKCEDIDTLVQNINESSSSRHSETASCEMDRTPSPGENCTSLIFNSLQSGKSDSKAKTRNSIEKRVHFSPNVMYADDKMLKQKCCVKLYFIEPIVNKINNNEADTAHYVSVAEGKKQASIMRYFKPQKKPVSSKRNVNPISLRSNKRGHLKQNRKEMGYSCALEQNDNSQTHKQLKKMKRSTDKNVLIKPCLVRLCRLDEAEFLGWDWEIGEADFLGFDFGDDDVLDQSETAKIYLFYGWDSEEMSHSSKDLNIMKAVTQSLIE